MIKTYYKTATIKAEQFDNSREMAEKYHVEYNGASYILPFGIDTPKGWLGIKVDDWIVVDNDGKYWPIADDVFKKTYAELPVIPKAVADWIDKCKHERVSISFAMYEDNFPKEVADYFRTYYTRDQWITIQDNFVRAWLDGYVVEGNK